MSRLMSDTDDGQQEMNNVEAKPRQRGAAPHWLVVAGVVIAVATGLGAAFAPYLLVHHPLWLLVLNSWPRHQVLVAPQLAIAPFVAVVAARGVASCGVAFELGRYYGTRGVALIEGHSAESGRVVRTVERLFGRFSVALLVLTPGWLTSALAGMSGVSRQRCLTLNGMGLTAWAVTYHQLGGWLEPWTAPIVQFLRSHVLVATAVCALLVAVYQGYVLRKRRLASVFEPSRRDVETKR